MCILSALPDSMPFYRELSIVLWCRVSHPLWFTTVQLTVIWEESPIRTPCQFVFLTVEQGTTIEFVRRISLPLQSAPLTCVHFTVVREESHIRIPYQPAALHVRARYKHFRVCFPTQLVPFTNVSITLTLVNSIIHSYLSPSQG